jgi:hypothetical protein
MVGSAIASSDEPIWNWLGVLEFLFDCACIGVVGNVVIARMGIATRRLAFKDVRPMVISSLICFQLILKTCRGYHADRQARRPPMTDPFD